MAYKIVLTKEAAKDLRALDAKVTAQIVKKLVWFDAQTDPVHFAKRLHQPAAGDLRFRVGDYRLIAIINAKLHRIEVVQIGHRRNIYLK